jgi:hypothetical protein
MGRCGGRPAITAFRPDFWIAGVAVTYPLQPMTTRHAPSSVSSSAIDLGTADSLK